MENKALFTARSIWHLVRLSALLSTLTLSAQAGFAAADGTKIQFQADLPGEASLADDLGYLFGFFTLAGDLKMGLELENLDTDNSLVIPFKPIGSLDGDPSVVAILPGTYFIKRILFASPTDLHLGADMLRAHYIPTAFTVEPGEAYYLGRAKGNSASSIQGAVFNYFEISYWIDKFDQDRQLLTKHYPEFQSMTLNNATTLKSEWQRELRCQDCD